MNVPVARPQVAAFVAAVRTQLDDLSPEDVDDLTDGLEADLNDALTDSGAAPAEQFGDAAAYAAELRAAAGLPPRAVHEGGRPGAVDRARRRAALLAADVRGRPWWPTVRDFVLVLRPAWWVVRAWVAAALVALVLDVTPWLPFLPLLVASVELGRRRIAERTRAWRTVVVIGNLLAAAFLIPVLAGHHRSGSTEVVYAAPAGGGIMVDGKEVTNIYPFDSAGHPLTGVQLLDQDGRPIAVGDAARAGTMTADPTSGALLAIVPVPAVDGSGQQRWNVYPLRQRTDTDNGSGTTITGTPSTAPWPTVVPQPLLEPPSPTPTPGPTTGPTTGPASPTSSPSGPTSSATASPTTSPSASPTASRAG